MIKIKYGYKKILAMSIVSMLLAGCFTSNVYAEEPEEQAAFEVEGEDEVPVDSDDQSEYYSIEDTELVDAGTQTTVQLNPTYVESSNTYSESTSYLCEASYTTNKNSHNYDGNWSVVNKSYLIETTDGLLMKFHVNSSRSGVVTEDYYLVEYYDKDFNFVSYRKVPCELNRFGGFYYDGSSYYILSGQNNIEENNSVEVYRLTKYDTDWNRFGTTASLFGANTVHPFEAGSASFAHDGNLLFIRTCHEMYKASDGRNHQANVTIQINTADMSVIGSMYDVMNCAYGYVSHSFNQFIELDGGYIVAVDHGDASVTRGICIGKYRNKYNPTSFSNRACTYNILPFPGTSGANYTGATVGSFVMTDSCYLIAGTVNNQVDYYNSSTQNVFILSMARDSVKNTYNTLNGATAVDFDTKLTKVTNYNEGSVSASTPFLVDIGNGLNELMWGRSGKVYYCTVDAYGDLVGDVHYFNADLSDCEPIVVEKSVGGTIQKQLVWFVCENSNNIFYSIDLNNPSQTSTRLVMLGHKNVWEDATSANPNAVIKCELCGDSHTYSTIQGFDLTYSISVSGNSSYRFWTNTPTWECGNIMKVWLYNLTPSYPDIHGVTVTSSDTDIVKDTEILDATIGQLKLGTKEGEVTLTFTANHNPSVQKEARVMVRHQYVQTGTKPATATSPAMIIETCSGCGAQREVPGESLSCKVLGASVYLTDRIAIKFSLSQLPIGSTIVAEGAWGKVTKEYDPHLALSDGTYYFTCEIPAQHMRTVSELYVLDANGERIDLKVDNTTYTEIKWSLYKYFQAELNNSTNSSNCINLVKGLIEYCDNAAYYFGSDNRDVVYVEYTSNTMANTYAKNIYAVTNPQTYSMPEGVEYAGSSLVLDGCIKIRHYFMGDMSNCKITIGNMNYELIAVGGGVYYVEYANVFLNSLASPHEVKLTDSSHTWIMKYYPISYCYDATRGETGKLYSLCVSLYNLWKLEKYYG